MEIDEELLGTTGICEHCGKEGTWCYNPYYEDVENEKVLECMCDDCYDQAMEDI